MTIEVRGRESRFRASVKGEPGCWGRGKTPNEAIGDCIRSHGEAFGVGVSEDRDSCERTACRLYPVRASENEVAMTAADKGGRP